METPSIVIVCCYDDCGITFAVPQWLYKGKTETRKRFFCPNGHGQSFTGENKEEALRRERDIARQQVARAEEEAASAKKEAIRAKKETVKLKKRASAGTCPCCSRTFSNMATHMKREHPEFVQAGGANVVPIKVQK